jgi:DNA-directed RNA polymerase subunit beta'
LKPNPTAALASTATMRYVTNSKKELVVISRSGEIVIHDEHGRERERHKVPYGAMLAVKADRNHQSRYYSWPIGIH